ncbi:hypothetical protein A3755_15165 [Oleiphilus sp. HI0085]|nr:hypothetical protein A3755_15165 [Oleiphilus sp. HI0085]
MPPVVHLLLKGCPRLAPVYLVFVLAPLLGTFFVIIVLRCIITDSVEFAALKTASVAYFLAIQPNSRQLPSFN